MTGFFSKVGLVAAGDNPQLEVAGPIPCYSVPLATWMLRSYFDGIPRELDKAANPDGFWPLRIFVQIILPLAKAKYRAHGYFLVFLFLQPRHAHPFAAYSEVDVSGAVKG